MNKSKIILIFSLILMLCIGYILGFLHTASTTKEQESTPRKWLSTVTYLCDRENKITAVYYDEPQLKPSQPTVPPTPTGVVELTINDVSLKPLKQTISASGIRYSNQDESFIFWSKGKEALLTNGFSPDLNFTNCTAQ